MLPLLAKDDLKETLFDTLGVAGVEESRRLGVAALALLFRTAGELLAAGVSLVLEGNFADPEPFAALPPARVVRLQLTAPPEVLLERFLARPRHPGHQTEAYAPEIRRRIEAREWDGADLPGRLIAVDTTRPVDVPRLTREIFE
jgi:predicted kinase